MQAEKRDKRISIKVTNSVFEFLELEANKRGIAPGSLCSFIVGDWKSQIQDQNEGKSQRSVP